MIIGSTSRNFKLLLYVQTRGPDHVLHLKQLLLLLVLVVTRGEALIIMKFAAHVTSTLFLLRAGGQRLPQLLLREAVSANNTSLLPPQLPDRFAHTHRPVNLGSFCWFFSSCFPRVPNCYPLSLSHLPASEPLATSTFLCLGFLFL